MALRLMGKMPMPRQTAFSHTLKAMGGDGVFYVAQVLFAMVMALAFTLVFAIGLRRPGPWSSIVTFFVVLFLAIWAGSLWISPAGPMLMGIFWLPLILIAFFVAVLLAAAGPRPTQRAETISQAKEQEQIVKRAFDALFWTLLIGFVIVIVLGYLLRAPAA